jgi:hypothetical protein
MHIPLSVKPNKQITSSTTYVYNRKRFHNIVLQVVCDCDIFFGMWSGKWKTFQNVKFVSLFSIKTDFARTSCYY